MMMFHTSVSLPEGFFLGSHPPVISWILFEIRFWNRHHFDMGLTMGFHEVWIGIFSKNDPPITFWPSKWLEFGRDLDIWNPRF